MSPDMSSMPPQTPRVLPALCSRVGDDDVRDVFCGATAPEIRSLTDLERLLGIEFPEDASSGTYAPYGYGSGDAPRLAVLAHSTALSGDLVSPLNPRAIMVGASTFVAFNRGVQQTELASLDRDRNRVNLYLVSFEQACSATDAGCSPGDLFTPRIESNWTRVSIQDDEDLKNTPSDCRQCHQRGVASPLLLMRELDGPWTHFFGPDQDLYSAFPEPTGTDLVRDYLRAKGDETYAGIPGAAMRQTIGFTLENMVSFPQPLVFDSSVIMNERWPWSQATGYLSEPVRSATWEASYEAFKRGEQLAMPYFAPRATDADKQSRLSDAYKRFRAGELGAEDLPDLADIFPDDPQTRAEIGLQAEPGASPAQALVQACGTCHNDVLDQTISRARFNVAVSRLSRAELDTAVARLGLAPDVPGAMPPPGRRKLDTATRTALIDYLKSDDRSPDDVAALDHAARVGMAQVMPSKPIF